MIPPSQRLREALIAMWARWRSVRLHWPLMLCALTLLALDLLRSTVPPLRESSGWSAALMICGAEWAIGLATLVLVALALDRGGVARPRVVAMLGLGLLLLGTYTDRLQDVKSDGILYYSYLRSVLFDFDLSLGNDFLAIERPGRLPMSGSRRLTLGPHCVGRRGVLILRRLR